MDEWKAVRTAVEQALPFYEFISEIIAVGLAGPLRRRAIRRLESQRDKWILDSGTGPGVSSRMMIDDGFHKIIGLDPSLFLLRSAKERLRENFHPVLAVAENLPFPNESVAGAIACFSLRDVRNRSSSIGEFARVVQRGGRLEVVDIGKPESRFLQIIIGLYIQFVMPVVARIFIGKRSTVNPFRMITPTFRRLLENGNLNRLVLLSFGSSRLQEFMCGGLIIIEAQRVEDV